MIYPETSGHCRVPDGLDLPSGDDYVGFDEHANASKAERTKPSQSGLGTARLETSG